MGEGHHGLLLSGLYVAAFVLAGGVVIILKLKMPQNPSK